MALTESTMELELGAQAPDFALPDVVTGNTVRRDDFRGQKGLLVMFICTHCPYVKHVEKGVAALGADYEGKGIGIVAISSNDAETYPDDAPAVARAYHAACTPDFFLFDSGLKLVYRGQFDGSRPNSGLPVTGQDLRIAMDAVIAGKPVAKDQKPSIGCNIKWKGGY